MSLFDGMKDKLGFGNKPEWQDGDYQDGDYQDDGSGGYGYGEDAGYSDDGYSDEGYAGDSAGAGSHSSSVVSFDAYNPSNFDNVKISSESEPRVASYDDLGKSRFSSRSSSGYGSSRSGSSTVRPLGSRSGSGRSRSGDSSASGSSSGSGSSWTPSDPSFLDNQGPAYGTRDVMDEIHAADPYSSLGSDFLNASKDPATHLEIVRPGAYADVEKIATAAKAGKSVILVVSQTKPALAKRILDFSFGVASALNMNVDKAADRVFVLSRGAEMLSEDERSYLVDEGILK